MKVDLDKADSDKVDFLFNEHYLSGPPSMSFKLGLVSSLCGGLTTGFYSGSILVGVGIFSTIFFALFSIVTFIGKRLDKTTA